MTNLDMGDRNSEFVENSNEVPSPFIPGTNLQFAWDSTSLGYLKTCPRLYQYIVIDGYTSKEENVHLRFGGEYHQCISDYKRERAANIPHDDAVFDVIKALIYRIDDWWPDHKYKNRISLLHAVIGYLDGHDEDKVETIIKEDGEPAVEFSFRFEMGRMANESQPYLLCGHMDDVVMFQDDYFIRDHKTTTSTPGNYYWQQFEPNNQMTLYTLASRVILNRAAKGVIIDSAQILLTEPFVRFTRGMTYRTEEQLDEWLHDLDYWLDQAEIYAERSHWPQNDTACNMYGGCRFRHVCAASPQVRDMILQSDFDKGEGWNPLLPR